MKFTRHAAVTSLLASLVALSSGACGTPPDASISEASASASEAIIRLPLGRTATVTSISLANDGHGCLRSSDGTVSCWGSNGFEQVGDQTTVAHPNPVVVSGITDAVQVAVATSGSCALRANGTVSCWGDLLPSFNPATPTTFPGVTNAVSIVAGDAFYCAVLASGGVTCWGNNSEGQLGVPATATIWTGATNVPGVTNAIAVAAGSDHACALGRYGSVVCWGSNGAGQLTAALPSSYSIPPTTMALANIRQISANTNNTCVVNQTGAVICWGDNNRCQAGAGAAGCGTRAAFNTVTGIAPALSVAVGWDQTCATLSDGTVRCWGVSYELGDGETTLAYHLGTSSVTGAQGATVLASGVDATCAAVGTDVKCWGDQQVFNPMLATPTSIFPASVYFE